MLGLYFGLLLVFICVGLILADMERRRRQLADMLNRFEPLVGRDRRFHIRNLRGMNSSVFYAGNLMDSLEREVATLEQAKGVQPRDRQARFSLWPGRRYRDLDERVCVLEAMAGTGPAGASAPAPPPPADPRGADPT